MLESLSPSSVWKYFEQFCTIPHPSGHEQKAAEYIIRTAARLGLPAITDATGNILVKKQATDDFHATTIILQSHLDMVPQKNENTRHDFITDPIRPFVDGKWVKAKGTTLGADNGIGVAITLAILENSTIKHGPIEALFTLDEERGMTGAFGLTPEFLSGRTMINLDTEEENEICIGCAGGTDIKCSIPVTFENAPENYRFFLISLKGLQGGHSGMEIHLGRANALKITADFLQTLKNSIPIKIAIFNGGSARNAIPREAFCTIAVPESHYDALNNTVEAFQTTTSYKFKNTDPDLCFKYEAVNSSYPVLSELNVHQLLDALTRCPNGVISMSPALPTVQTSNNCAIVKTESDSLRIDCMLRSSLDSELQHYKNRISEIFITNGGRVSYGSMYPGWQPVDSNLLSTMKNAYIKVHQKEPNVVAVHAGLECGIIGSKYPGIEMISCGPTIRFAHSPDEQMNIPSVERFWRCLITGLDLIK